MSFVDDVASHGMSPCTDLDSAIDTWLLMPGSDPRVEPCRVGALPAFSALAIDQVRVLAPAPTLRYVHFRGSVAGLGNDGWSKPFADAL
jgi:hypothetical protein